MTDAPTPEDLEQLARSVAMSGVLGDRDRLDVVAAWPQPSIKTRKPQALVPFYVVATTTFHGPDDLTLIEGTVKRSDDPIVKAHPDVFRPVEDLAG